MTGIKKHLCKIDADMLFSSSTERINFNCDASCLTLKRSMSLSHKNQSIDLQSKSIDWFLCERDIDR